MLMYDIKDADCWDDPALSAQPCQFELLSRMFAKWQK